jgi:hypothetical protein
MNEPVWTPCRRFRLARPPGRPQFSPSAGAVLLLENTDFGRILEHSRHLTSQLSPDLQVTKTPQSKYLGEIIVTIKNVVIPLETMYLQGEAKRLGVSRTKLVRVVMEKIVRDELVSEILDDEPQVLNEPLTSKYRRFPRKNSH